MVLGIGIDTVAIERFRSVMERRKGLASRLFTASELESVSGRKDSVGALAGRFALKEAVLKALGTGLSGGIRWHDIEVTKDAAGKPEVNLSGSALLAMKGLGGRRFLVSVSHDSLSAVAVAVLEGEGV